MCRERKGKMYNKGAAKFINAVKNAMLIPTMTSGGRRFLGKRLLNCQSEGVGAIEMV